MAIGLTFRQLMATFAEALDRRDKEFNVEMLTAEVGVNPATKRLTDMFSGQDEKQSRAYIVHLMAILDVIVANNIAIAKSPPPL